MILELENYINALLRFVRFFQVSSVRACEVDKFNAICSYHEELQGYKQWLRRVGCVNALCLACRVDIRLVFFPLTPFL